MERAFPNPSKKENHRKREGAKRLPLVGNEGGKKHRQKPEFPLTGAGLLMEGAETLRKPSKNVFAAWE